MADLSHVMGNDFTLSPTGDLAVATAAAWGQQRVLRRLLTTPGADLWALEYGAGLPLMIGQPADPRRIAAITKAQMLQESAVGRSPMPDVQISAQNNGVVVEYVRYADATTGTSQILTFPAS